ncbi:Uncharacterised protein [Serratia proteamaculans]|nr:Uncharacterised protein [Serratia proteamaculans]CAI1905948.1 Uncharacterised protein [Serratia proteamaculans]
MILGYEFVGDTPRNYYYFRINISLVNISFLLSSYNSCFVGVLFYVFSI